MKKQPKVSSRRATKAASTAKPGASSSPGTPKTVGRPRLIQSPEQAQEQIEAYFTECDTTHEPYTVPGLAYSLGFNDRHAIAEYAAKPEYSATMKNARLRIERQRNAQLLTDGQVIGKIFDLKNNFGWIDSQHIEHDVNLRNMTDGELQSEIEKLESNG